MIILRKFVFFFFLRFFFQEVISEALAYRFTLATTYGQYIAPFSPKHTPQWQLRIRHNDCPTFLYHLSIKKEPKILLLAFNWKYFIEYKAKNDELLSELFLIIKYIHTCRKKGSYRDIYKCGTVSNSILCFYLWSYQHPITFLEPENVRARESWVSVRWWWWLAKWPHIVWSGGGGCFQPASNYKSDDNLLLSRRSGNREGLLSSYITLGYASRVCLVVRLCGGGKARITQRDETINNRARTAQVSLRWRGEFISWFSLLYIFQCYWGRLLFFLINH